MNINEIIKKLVLLIVLFILLVIIMQLDLLINQDSTVAIKIENISNIYKIMNVGDTVLDIEVSERNATGWKPTGSFILDIKENASFELRNLTLFKARQK